MEDNLLDPLQTLRILGRTDRPYERAYGLLSIYKQGSIGPSWRIVQACGTYEIAPELIVHMLSTVCAYDGQEKLFSNVGSWSNQSLEQADREKYE